MIQAFKKGAIGSRLIKALLNVQSCYSFTSTKLVAIFIFWTDVYSSKLIKKFYSRDVPTRRVNGCNMFILRKPVRYIDVVHLLIGDCPLHCKHFTI